MNKRVWLIGGAAGFLILLVAAAVVVMPYGWKVFFTQWDETRAEIGAAHERREIALAFVDLRTLSMNLGMFELNYGRYPLPGESGTLNDAGIQMDDGEFATLTHPIVYMDSIPNDKLSPTGEGYRYHSNGEWYILASNGPNRKADLDVTLFNPDEGVGVEELKDYFHNSSNGMQSGGDIVISFDRSRGAFRSYEP